MPRLPDCHLFASREGAPVLSNPGQFGHHPTVFVASDLMAVGAVPNTAELGLREYGVERVLVNSAADWGHSDPLLTVATGQALLAAGFSADDVDRVLWRNPVAFYGQSGRLDVSEAAETGPLYQGSSILRGGS